LPGFPARDWFAPTGSSVFAPVDGVVSRLSGHPPENGPTEGPHGPFGLSLYIRGDNGHIYYMTHFGSRAVRLHDRVVEGQRIGVVGDYAKWGTPSHIHMGVHR